MKHFLLYYMHTIYIRTVLLALSSAVLADMLTQFSITIIERNNNVSTLLKFREPTSFDSKLSV